MLISSIKLVHKNVIEGYGLITDTKINKGEIIWRLDPREKVIELSEVKQWPLEKQEEFEQFSYQCGENQFIIPRGISKYMNHSCDPNVWWKDSRTQFAYRDIQAGEELTYDYPTCDILRDYSMKCNCGSKCCRKVVTNKDYLDTEWQKKYGMHLPAHVLKAIEESKIKA